MLSTFFSLFKIKYNGNIFLKPENIMYNPKSGAVKIIDFGLSKCTSDGVKLNTVVGTPFYLAPEVL